MPTIPLNLLAFQSEWLALRMAKRGRMPSSSYTKTASPFRPGRRPEAEFSGNENSFFYMLLGWAPIVLSALSSINRAVFRSFHQYSAGDFAKGSKSAVVARRNRLLSCNSETV
jgi:hypothetical protein